MFRVTVPNKHYGGRQHGVQFTKGVGIATEAQAKYLKATFGYTIKEVTDPDPAPEASGETADDLTQITGIGEKSAENLVSGGFDSFQSIVDGETEAIIEASGARGVNEEAVKAWKAQASAKLQ